MTRLLMPYVMSAKPPLDCSAPGPDTTLAGLRGLAKLADCRPVLVVDSREQDPLEFTRLQVVKGTLYSGDYSILNWALGFRLSHFTVCAVEEDGIPALGGVVVI